ncbi:MAG: hypothetical protein A2Z96_02085 [Spirochaetes bacterium GWB1_48_6]|nr:MAG: hypothetical protein A2Z96_02085 [Spirochaetes bacterium GWB1_48_6]
MSVVLKWGRGGLVMNPQLEETRTLTVPNASLPSIAILPLLQYPGQDSHWILGAGQRVEEGMVVATGPDGNLHSPIPGLIEKITEMTLPGNFVTSAAQIRLEGSFTRSAEVKTPNSWESKSPKDLLKILKESGVLFSSSAMGELKPVRENNAKKLVINGLQSEPYLTVPFHLMANYQREIREAILILQKIYQPETTFLALGPEAEILFKNDPGPFTVVVSENIFPNSHEKILLKSLNYGEKNHGSDASEDHTLMVTLDTLYWVYDAVVWSNPVTEKFIAYGGHGFHHSGIIKVKIGTPGANIIQDCGGFRETPDLILYGGLFLGKPLNALWNPVVKNTPGLLAMTAGEVNQAPESPCIRCGVCITHCPVGIKPVEIYLDLKFGDFAGAHDSGLKDCIECGICSSVCPSRIPLMENFQDNLNKNLKSKFQNLENRIG